MAQVEVTQRPRTPGSGAVSRYRALLLTCRSLDEKLASELQWRRRDLALIQRLECRKLRVENELAELRRLLAAGSPGLRGAVGSGVVHPPCPETVPSGIATDRVFVTAALSAAAGSR